MHAMIIFKHVTGCDLRYVMNNGQSLLGTTGGYIYGVRVALTCLFLMYIDRAL
jgi:hypothetical protein